MSFWMKVSIYDLPGATIKPEETGRRLQTEAVVKLNVGQCTLRTQDTAKYSRVTYTPLIFQFPVDLQCLRVDLAVGCATAPTHVFVLMSSVTVLKEEFSFISPSE